MFYKGSCHCGAIKFEFEGGEINCGLRCNCSICIRKGVLMSEYVIPPNDFKIQALPKALSLYQFSSNVAKHYFCNQCGIYTFHQTMACLGHYRINLVV